MAAFSALLTALRTDLVWQITAVVLNLLAYPHYQVIYNLYFHPLRKFHGPLAWRASRLPFVFNLLRGTLI